MSEENPQPDMMIAVGPAVLADYFHVAAANGVVRVTLLEKGNGEEPAFRGAFCTSVAAVQGLRNVLTNVLDQLQAAEEPAKQHHDA